MSRKTLVLVHWHPSEARALSAQLDAAGWEVFAEHGDGALTLRHVKELAPVAAVVFLRRIPSHGRAWAGALQAVSWGRAIPLIFVDGAADKVATTRGSFPDASYCSWEQLLGLLDTVAAQRSGA